MDDEGRRGDVEILHAGEGKPVLQRAAEHGNAAKFQERTARDADEPDQRQRGHAEAETHEQQRRHFAEANLADGETEAPAGRHQHREEKVDRAHEGGRGRGRAGWRVRPRRRRSAGVGRNRGGW